MPDKEAFTLTVIQILCRQTWQGVPVANVLCFDQSDVSESGIQNTVDQLGAAWFETMRTKQSLNWSLDSFLVRVFDGGEPFSASYDSPDTPFVGTADSPDLPRHNAILISTSATGPRPNRGRIYVAGPTESSWDGDSWDSPTIGVAESFATALVGLADTKLVVARRNYAANTAVGHDVTSWVTQGYSGSQRGRRT